MRGSYRPDLGELPDNEEDPPKAYNWGDPCPDCGKLMDIDDGQRSSRTQPEIPACIYCPDCGTEHPNKHPVSQDAVNTPRETAGSQDALVRRIASTIYWSINVVSAVCLMVAVVMIGWLVWTALGDSKELRELAWFAALTIGVMKALQLIAYLHAWAKDARKTKSPNTTRSATGEKGPQ